MNAVPIIRGAGEGEQFWFAGGGVFTMKATAAETAGAMTLIEDRVVAGKSTPLHAHPELDESIYVLAGEILVDIDGDQRRLGPGGLAVSPRGVAHAFLVTSEAAHLLVLQTPGRGEDFYRDSSEPVMSEADAARAPDMERLRAAATRSPSIELLGPPPFAGDGV